MTEVEKKYRDPRAEKLRASGMVGNPVPRVKAGSEAMRRARVSRRQGALGASLSESVRKKVRAQPGTDIQFLHPALAGGALSICMAIAGFVADGFIAMVVLGAAGFVLGVLVIRAMKGNRGIRDAGEALASAAEFDAFVAARGARLPDSATASLGEMKSLFARLFPALRSTQAVGALGADDVFFIHQSIKRYLPDAIDPYLALQTPTDKALQAMQARSQAEAAALALQAVKAREADLFADPNAPVIGNPEGDVTVVEFFDYNCPYCRQAAPELKMLIERDPMIRVVMREWPILGPDSVYAARASLAARSQGKYAEFHDAMMAMPRANEIAVRRVATDLGLDLAQLTDGMQDPSVAAHLDKSNELSSNLGINGTPGFVIGETIIRGYTTYEDLAAVVADTRANSAAAPEPGAADE